MPASGDREGVEISRGSARAIARHLRQARRGDDRRGDGVPPRREIVGGPRMPKLGRAVGAVSANTTGTFAVYQGHPKGSESASGESIEAMNYGSALPNNTWVLLHHNGFEWYTVDRFGAVDLAVFYLNDQLPQFGSASATLCVWDGDSWEPGPGDPVTVYDVAGSGPANQSDKGVAWLAPSGRWEIIELPAQTTPLQPFYLNEYLAKGGSASATLVTPSGGIDSEWVADGPNITVLDTAARFGPAGPGHRGVAARIVVDDNPDHDYWIVFSLDETKLHWAKATSNWVRVVGMNLSYVDCELVTDSGGATTIDDADENPIEVRVYLPSDCAADPGSRIEPNVRAGMVICFGYDDNGVAFSNDPAVYDDPIWTMKMSNAESVASLRGGWRNVSDMAGRVPLGVDTGGGAADEFYEGDPSTVGATGGVTHHKDPDHTFTPTGEFSGSASGSASLTGGGISGSGSLTTSSEVTGISVEDHDPHYHSLLFSTPKAGSGAVVDVVYPLAVDTTTEKAAGSPTTLSHTVNDPGHDHTVDGADIASLLSLTGDVELTDLEVSGDITLDEITLTHPDRTVIQPWRTTWFIERFE